MAEQKTVDEMMPEQRLERIRYWCSVVNESLANVTDSLRLVADKLGVSREDMDYAIVSSLGIGLISTCKLMEIDPHSVIDGAATGLKRREEAEKPTNTG